MTDNPILTPQHLPDDVDAALRPKTLAEFVGQVAALARPVELEDKFSP